MAETETHFKKLIFLGKEFRVPILLPLCCNVVRSHLNRRDGKLF